MAYVVDASVAMKWLVVEEDADRAIALLHSGEPLLAPRWIMTELASALWKKVRQDLLRPAIASERFQLASHYFAYLLDTSNMSDVLELAVWLDHPVYDCFYTQAALDQHAPLIIADRRLHRKASSIPGLQVFDLSNWASGTPR